ncbi:MAG: fumarylacetoacetate hydrolase family protein [Xanthomonadales bacterium]|nr:fumarylacetoacetate hydrolase family protein [Xanthomonadales bacterium]
MKLASLKQGGRDGSLIIVSRGLDRYISADSVATTMQAALDNWDTAAPRLNALSEQLNAGELESLPLHFEMLAAPLPRAYEFVDGSAYLPHVERVRKARGAQVPESFYVDPLMYQGTSSGFLGPREDVAVISEDYGIDFESEVIIITDDVPMGIDATAAADHIQLIGLINDVSLRNLIPGELAKGFGFLHSKPRSTLSPVFVTPDELGDAWQDSVLSLPLLSNLNGEFFGNPEAGVDMQFNFAQLLAHAVKTRPLCAGAIVGSGTIANQDTTRGASCLAEKRMLEIIADGKPKTAFMSFGDRIHIEMLNTAGESIFGDIDQRIVQYSVT